MRYPTYSLTYLPRNRPSDGTGISSVELEITEKGHSFITSHDAALNSARDGHFLTLTSLEKTSSILSGAPAVRLRTLEIDVQLTPEELTRLLLRKLSEVEYFKLREEYGVFYEISSGAYDESTGKAPVIAGEAQKLKVYSINYGSLYGTTERIAQLREEVFTSEAARDARLVEPGLPKAYVSYEVAREVLQKWLSDKRDALLANIRQLDTNLARFEEYYPEPRDLFDVFSENYESFVAGFKALEAKPGRLKIGDLNITNTYLGRSPGLYVFHLEEYLSCAQTFTAECCDLIKKALNQAEVEIESEWNGPGFQTWSVQSKIA